MEETVRYCRRCRAMTDQWRQGIGRRWPLLLPLLWLLDPWRCERCELGLVEDLVD